jgi:hypothetical protein
LEQDGVGNKTFLNAKQNIAFFFIYKYNLGSHSQLKRITKGQMYTKIIKKRKQNKQTGKIHQRTAVIA